MINNRNSVNVRSAKNRDNSFDLSRDVLYTSNFYQFMPILVQATVPGDKFDVDVKQFLRLQPLMVPTYGRFYNKFAAFWVPNHLVGEDLNAWFQNLDIYQGIASHPRIFEMEALKTAFLNGPFCQQEVPSATTYDFMTIVEGETRKYSLLRTGKIVLQIFRSLGYPNPWDYQKKDPGETFLLNAIPLLAFVRVMADWFTPSQIYPTTAVCEFMTCVRQNKDFYFSGQVIYDSNTGYLSASVLELLFSNWLKQWYCVTLDNDVVTSPWRYPDHPYSQTSNIIEPNVYPNDNFDDAVNIQNNVDYMTTTSSINARAINLLKKAHDYVIRNGLAGARYVQRMFAHFGVQSNDAKTHYAHLLERWQSEVLVGDVTSQSDTLNGSVGRVLGDYAGKALGNGDGHVSATFDDFGTFIVLQWLEPKIINGSTTDRECLKYSPTDFYTPEYDSEGVTEQHRCESYTFDKTSALPNKDSNYPVGYMPRYYEYKRGRDLITGDFVRYDGMDSWHLMREFKPNESFVAQSIQLVTQNYQTGDTYLRIFQNPDPSADHVYYTTLVRFNAQRPMLSIDESTGLPSGNTRLTPNMKI
ncbi:major capsid protein [Capybara microvirus Cap1_SP_148]|nr:major capsid protein [Capybara microvirus Cap1_SP_148]